MSGVFHPSSLLRLVTSGRGALDRRRERTQGPSPEAFPSLGPRGANPRDWKIATHASLTRTACVLRNFQGWVPLPTMQPCTACTSTMDVTRSG
ncbi:hypothetical protein VTK56DRAFT_680 [Thermocarpiscus australiensis]